MFSLSKLGIGSIVFSGILGLSACGGGDLDESYFQADNISASAGNVCIDGVYISPNGNEAKETVSRLKQFYGGVAGGETTVHSAVVANCTSTKDKPAANTIITKVYYEGTIIPATKY